MPSINELIHAIDKAKNQMIDIEKLSDIELDELAQSMNLYGPHVWNEKPRPWLAKRIETALDAAG